MNNIVIEKVNKTYKNGKKALHNMTLSIDENTVFGLVGPNGAGKSTLIKSILGLVAVDSGKILINGKENVIKNIGYMPEETFLFEFLTGLDYLTLIAKLRDVPMEKLMDLIIEMKDLLELPDLSQFVSTYSKGNKEKLLFLSSIVHKPDILILDEPFTGLDPVVIQNVKKFIVEYAKQGRTVILSTHILEMVSEICNKIAVICNGRIVTVEDIDKNLGYEAVLDKYLNSIERI